MEIYSSLLVKYVQHAINPVIVVPGGLSRTVTPTDPKVIHDSPTSASAIQNVPKPMHRAPNSVQAVTHHKLPFKAHERAGLGYNGEIILSNGYSERYLYKMQHDGNEYKETWKKELPDGMWYGCCKEMSSNGYIFLQNHIDEKTVCYDESLTKTSVLNHKGVLVDSSKDEVFYRHGQLNDSKIIVHKTDIEERSTRGVLASALRKLQLGRQKSPHKTLKPPSPHRWQNSLSVCITEQGYVAVEFITSSMDIFDQDGRKYFAQKLYFISEIKVRK